MSNRIAMFTGRGMNFISAPLINSAEYLSAQGYSVDIFASESHWFAEPTFASPNISYYPYPVSKAPIPGRTLLVAPYVLNRLMGHKTYEFFVGFDPPGLINAALLGKWRRTPYVYHSLEIMSEAVQVHWQGKLNKMIERWLNRGAALTITQDEYRADVLARENHLARGQIAVVYNSQLGDPTPQKSLWLRERFEIPSTKYIVLVPGSLIEEHMVDLIAETVESWPEQFVLVLHGWFKYGPAAYERSIEDKVRRVVEKHSSRIFLSTTLLPYAEKNLVFQSADIGLVFYKPVGNNHRYVGAAAGKLFDFMRCGVPVIALDLPGMKELVEDTGVGVIVPDVGDIPKALLDVLRDYASHSEHSLLAFGQYNFAQSYEKALARVPRRKSSRP